MKENLIYVSHILTAIADIKEFTKGMTKKGFLKNKITLNGLAQSYVFALFVC